MYTWRKYVDHFGRVTYYADRPDGTQMNVLVNDDDGTHDIHIYSHATDKEYLYGDIPDLTTNECIARAEAVDPPGEDTGI